MHTKNEVYMFRLSKIRTQTGQRDRQTRLTYYKAALAGGINVSPRLKCTTTFYYIIVITVNNSSNNSSNVSGSKIYFRTNLSVCAV